MAKSKATISAKQPSSAPAKRKANAAPPRTKSAPAISSSEIGRVAGEVWGVLSRDGGLTLAAVKKSVDAPADIVVAAIGWLAREDKLEFTSGGRMVTISLR